MNFVQNTHLLIKLTIIFTLTINSHAQVNFNSLKLAQVIFRHGDKEPDKTYPDGVGKLTDIGKQQLFDLGVYLRGRYDGFIGQTYDPDEVYILSSEKDRTIQSAQMMAYGLYKNFNFAASWHDPPIQFEPIAIRSIPVEYDRLLQPSKNCPRRTEIYRQARTEVGAQYFEQNDQIIQYYARHGGDQVKEIVNEERDAGERVAILHLRLEQLTYDKNHNLTLEPWTLRLYEDEGLFSLQVAVTRGQVGTLEGKRLYSGSLIKHFIKNMEDKVSGLDDLKIKLFSAHDQTIQYFLTSLKMDDLSILHTPNFGSALMIELHQDHSGPFIEFWYRNDTRVEPHLLHHPDCGVHCPLDQFKKLTAHLIPTNFEQECLPKNQIKSVDLGQENTASGTVLVFGALAVIFVGVVLFVGLKWRKRNYARV